MVPQPDAQDLKREVQATFAARRELGAEYDEQFIERLVERLTTHARQDVARAPSRARALSPEQRTAVAICSLIFGIPLVAIGGGIAGATGLIIAFVALVLINATAGMMR
jgi:phytoene/squalene synthetase